MANITQSDLQYMLDAPPSYDELFGPPEGKSPETVTSPVEESEAVIERHREEEEEARRLRNNQNRYLVRDTRSNPPEAPHFLAPDLRPWLRERGDIERTSDRQELNSGRPVRNTLFTTRPNESREVTRSYRPDVTRPRTNLYAAEMALYPHRYSRPVQRPQQRSRLVQRSQQRCRSSHRGCTVD